MWRGTGVWRGRRENEGGWQERRGHGRGYHLRFEGRLDPLARQASGTGGARGRAFRRCGGGPPRGLQGR